MESEEGDLSHLQLTELDCREHLKVVNYFAETLHGGVCQEPGGAK